MRIYCVARHVDNSMADICTPYMAWYFNVHSLYGHSHLLSIYGHCEYEHHGHVTITCGCIPLLFATNQSCDGHVTITWGPALEALVPLTAECVLVFLCLHPAPYVLSEPRGQSSPTVPMRTRLFRMTGGLVHDL